MEQFYRTRIESLLESLRNSLVTAICLFFEQGRHEGKTISLDANRKVSFDVKEDDRMHVSLNDSLARITIAFPDGKTDVSTIPFAKMDVRDLHSVWKYLSKVS